MILQSTPIIIRIFNKLTINSTVSS